MINNCCIAYQQTFFVRRDELYQRSADKMAH